MAALWCFVILYSLSTAASVTVKQDANAISTLETYIKEKESQMNQRYRPHYHVAPPVGWMNDPNGFIFYKNEYHIFYQFYPYDSVWGPMHWGHSSSPDLVNWKTLPTALIPEEEQCFSGSAVVDGDNLILMYTGHVIDNTTTPASVNESQYLANSSDGVNFLKYEGNPVLPFAPNLSPDFRDPKVWRYGNYWYVVLGSKTDDQRGRILLYRSTDLINWEFLTARDSVEGDNMGYMWECPDFFELDGKFIVLMSPQGMEPVGDRFKNLYQTGYIIGNFSYETFEFTPESEFQELDFGHDFYATQTTDNNGTRYVVAWLGMWESNFLEAADGWSGALTLPRILSLHGDRLMMKPVEDIKNLRDSTVKTGTFEIDEVLEFETTAEIIFNGNLSQNIEIVLEGRDGGNTTWIKWNSTDGKVIVYRGSNDIRQVEWTPINSTQWRLFLDTSSLELFCGEGEVVFSSRTYPDKPWKVTNRSPQSLDIESYHLKRSVPYYSSSNRLHSVFNLISVASVLMLYRERMLNIFNI